ncbi:YeeE/YedE family protein [Halovulum sp. GXIMD14793]
MMDFLSDGQLAALIGLGGGIALGLAARLGRFCTLGAIEDSLYAQNNTRMRMWGLAIGVAMTGSFALIGAGWLRVEETIYLAQAFNPLAAITGGLMFGYGMALAGTCGYGALARAGGGDMKALVVALVMAVSAYMALSGPTAMLRVWLFPSASADQVPGLVHLAAQITDGSVTAIGIGTGLVIAAAMLAGRGLRQNPGAIFWSILVGLTAISAWAGTQWIADNGFDAEPVSAHSYAAPLGESLLYLMTASGNRLDFGVGSVTGVVLGAALATLAKGQFRWEACEDARELRRQLLGAFLMGTGAVTAMGCTIGQGLSAFSVMAYSAPVVFVAIFLGTAIGLRHLIHGNLGGSLTT